MSEIKKQIDQLYTDWELGIITEQEFADKIFHLLLTHA